MSTTLSTVKNTAVVAGIEIVYYHQFHLVVENKTGELLYYRNLTGDNILDISEYVPEIEQSTKLRFSLIPEESILNTGEIRITIAFNPPPYHFYDKDVWQYVECKIVD